MGLRHADEYARGVGGGDRRLPVRAARRPRAHRQPAVQRQERGRAGVDPCFDKRDRQVRELQPDESLHARAGVAVHAAGFLAVGPAQRQELHGGQLRRSAAVLFRGHRGIVPRARPGRVRRPSLCLHDLGQPDRRPGPGDRQADRQYSGPVAGRSLYAPGRNSALRQRRERGEDRPGDQGGHADRRSRSSGAARRHPRRPGQHLRERLEELVSGQGVLRRTESSCAPSASPAVGLGWAHGTRRVCSCRAGLRLRPAGICG